MNGRQKWGVVLILIGLALPLATFPLVRVDPQDVRLFGLGLAVTRGLIVLAEAESADPVVGQYWAGTRQSVPYLFVPYRYVLTAGIIILFVGVGFVILGRGAKSSSNGQSH